MAELQLDASLFFASLDTQTREKGASREFGITIAAPSKTPINFSAHSSRNSTLQNSLAVKSADHTWLLLRYFRCSGGVFAQWYRLVNRWRFSPHHGHPALRRGLHTIAIPRPFLTLTHHFRVQRPWGAAGAPDSAAWRNLDLTNLTRSGSRIFPPSRSVA